MKRILFSLLAIFFLFSLSGEKCWEKNFNFNTNTFTKILGNSYMFVGAEYSNSAIKWNYFQTDTVGKLEWDSTAYTPSFTDNPSIVATSDSGYMIAGVDNTFKFWKYNKHHKLTHTTSIDYKSNNSKTLYSLLQTRDSNVLAILGSELKILKLKPNGDSIWMKKYNNYYASTGLVKIDSESKGYYCTVIKDGVNELLKFDENGVILWDKTINSFSEFSCQPTALTVTKDGSFLITFGGYMVFYKLDINGNVVWRKNYSSIGANANCSAVAAAHDGGFMTANSVSNYLGSPTIFLMKLNADGDSTYTIQDKTATIFPQKMIEDPSDSSFILMATTMYYDDTRFYRFDSICHEISSPDQLKFYAKRLTCFPNPFESEINIKLELFIGKPAEVGIYNSNGVMILNRKIIIGTDKINTTQLPLGAYFLRLVVDGKLYGSKLIKRQ